MPFLLGLTALALLSGGCRSLQYKFLEGKELTIPRVYIISGYRPADPPPVPAFQQITPAQIKHVLSRQIVRVGKVVSIALGEPTPLYNPKQVSWITGHLASGLPRLKAGERIGLFFLDQYQNFEIEVEVYGEGSTLVFRYLRLAAMDARRGKPTEPGERPTNWVTFELQAGQTLDDLPSAIVLRESVLFDSEGSGASLAEKAQMIRDAFSEGLLLQEEANRMEALVGNRPDISRELVNGYLERRRTLKKAYQEGLITQEELAGKRATLDRDFGL